MKVLQVSLRSKAFRASRITLLSTLVALASQFILFALFARLLEPYQLGLVAIVGIANAFLDVFIGLGLPASLIHSRSLTSRETSSVYWTVVASNTFLAGLLVAISPIIADVYGDEALVQILSLAALAIAINGFGQVPKALLERRLRFKRVGQAEICYSVTLLTIAIYLSVAGWEAYSYAWALVAASTIRTVIWVFGARSTFIPRLYWRVHLLRRFLRFGAFQAADGIVTFVNNYISSLILGRFVGPTALGGYTLAYNSAVQTPAKLNPIITRVMFPVMSSIQTDRPRIALNYLRVSSLCVLALGPGLIALAIAAENFMVVVYGESFRNFSAVLSVLCLSGVLRAYRNPMGAMLSATGFVRLALYTNLIRSALTVPIVVYLVINWGSIGAAWGVFVSNLLGFVAGMFCSYLALNIRVVVYVLELLKALLPFGWMALLVFGIGFALNDVIPTLGVLFCQSGCGAIAYMLTCYFSKHPTLMYVRRFVLGLSR
ncbi:MOP flippase family protein [Kocuria nitroreducens]|uniref:MOP flippase family protein n=1 Tax=Kocuria nitroreducens TaxID=3058914 RepID=UPI0036DBB1FE